MFKDKSTQGVGSRGGKTQNQLSTMTPISEAYESQIGDVHISTIGKLKVPKRRLTDQVIRSSGKVFEEQSEDKLFSYEPSKLIKVTPQENLLDDDLETAVGISERLQNKSRVSEPVKSRGGLMPFSTISGGTFSIRDAILDPASRAKAMIVQNCEQRKSGTTLLQSQVFSIEDDEANVDVDDPVHNITDFSAYRMPKPVRSRPVLEKLSLESQDRHPTEHFKPQLLRSFTPMFNDLSPSNKRILHLQ